VADAEASYGLYGPSGDTGPWIRPRKDKSVSMDTGQCNGV
jgi:hypothetical protein